MKPWQWFVIITEAILLAGLLGVFAWIAWFNLPTTWPIAASVNAPVSTGSTPTQAHTPTPFIWPTIVPSAQPSPQPTNTRVISREALNQATVDKIEQQVVAIRQLEPRAAVPFTLMTRVELEDYVREQYKAKQKETLQELALYRALGLVQPDAVIDQETIVRTIAQNVAGFYEPQTRRLYVISDLENLGTDEKVTLAHEYTHALQDQYFNLGQYQARTQTTDERLAISAVYEGDATTVMSLYLYGNTTRSDWEYLAYRASFTDRAVITATGLSTRTGQISYFPYLHGAKFVAMLWLDGKGWEQVNHAYADPPRSTSIVLHPERYLTSHAAPVPIALPDLASALGGEWTATIGLDTLGEFVTRVHLDEFLNDPRRAAQAADGWEGDSFTLWLTTDDRQVFAWQFAWNTPRDTSEFFDAYAELLRRRVGANSVTEQDDANTCWYSGSKGSGLIRRTGEQTLVLWGPDKMTIKNLLTVFK